MANEHLQPVTEYLHPAEFREIVHRGNVEALRRRIPALLIVEAVSTSPAKVVAEMGGERFSLSANASEFVVPGARVILDHTEEQDRVIQPLGLENKPIGTFPVTY